MLVIRGKRKQRLLKQYRHDYNPNKRFQYMPTYTTKEGYLNNIKRQYKQLGKCIFIMLLSPFDVMIQLFKFSQSLMWWCLVYTSKKLKDDEIIENPKIKKIGGSKNE